MRGVLESEPSQSEAELLAEQPRYSASRMNATSVPRRRPDTERPRYRALRINASLAPWWPAWNVGSSAAVEPNVKVMILHFGALILDQFKTLLDCLKDHVQPAQFFLSKM